MIARVTVHERKGVYYVEAYDRTTKGVWLAGGAPAAVPADADPGTLGQVVRDALDQSRLDVTRSGRSDLTGPLLKLAGVASYATYTKGLKTVGIDSNDESGDLVIRITPTVKDADGFPDWKLDAEQTVVYESPGQLGTAVLNAFEASTPT